MTELKALLLTLAKDIAGLKEQAGHSQCQANPLTCCVGRALKEHIKSSRYSITTVLSAMAVLIALINGVASFCTQIMR